MINFIKAEFFRLKKDKLVQLVFAIVFIGYVSTTLLASVGDHCTRYSILFSSWQNQYYFILKLCVFLLCCIWTQEFRYETIKNIFSSGNGIEKFYFAKVIVQFIMCLILFIWALLCYILFFVMLPKESGDISFIAAERLKGLATLLLYSFAEISILNLIYMVIKKETLMFILYFLFVDTIGSIISKFTGMSFFKTISIGNGYDKAVSVFITSHERIITLALMLIYIIAVNLITFLLLKNEKLHC